MGITRPLYLVPGVLLFAVLYAWAVLMATQKFEPTLAGALVIGVPLAAFTVPFAVKQALKVIGDFRRQMEWWQILWLMTACSGLVFRIRDARSIQDAPLDIWAVYRIALVSTVAAVLFARLALGKTYWLESLGRGLVGFLTTYSVVAVFSTLWSVYPAWTFYKSAEYLVDVALLAAILAHVRSPERYKKMFDLSWMYFAALLTTVWIGVVVMPSLTLAHGIGVLGYQIQGALPALSANDVGEISAVFSVAALSRLLRSTETRPAFYTVALMAGLVTLAFSQTRSALAGFAVGALIVLLLSRRYALFAVLSLVGIAGAVTSSMDYLVAFFMRGQNAGLFLSLSGRTSWWEFAWQQFMERPWTGFGAYAGGRFAALSALGWATTSSLHNTYLELLLGVGFWGLVPMVMALVGTWKNVLTGVSVFVRTLAERQLVVEAAGVLAVVSIRTMFSPALIWHPDISFFLVLGLVELLRRRYVEERAAVMPGWAY